MHIAAYIVGGSLGMMDAIQRHDVKVTVHDTADSAVRAFLTHVVVVVDCGSRCVGIGGTHR